MFRKDLSKWTEFAIDIINVSVWTHLSRIKYLLPLRRRRWIRPTGNWRPARDDRDFAFPLTLPPFPRPDMFATLMIRCVQQVVSDWSVNAKVLWFIFIRKSALEARLSRDHVTSEFAPISTLAWSCGRARFKITAYQHPGLILDGRALQNFCCSH